MSEAVEKAKKRAEVLEAAADALDEIMSEGGREAEMMVWGDNYWYEDMNAWLRFIARRIQEDAK